ncbi:hypothetical protein ACT7CY_26825 [Bacillus pacificus]
MKKMIAVLFTCSFLLLGVQGMVEAADSSKELSYMKTMQVKSLKIQKFFIVRLKIIRIVLSMFLFMRLNIIYRKQFYIKIYNRLWNPK